MVPGAGGFFLFNFSNVYHFYIRELFFAIHLKKHFFSP